MVTVPICQSYVCTGRTALHDDPQVKEHVQDPSMLYRKNQPIDQEQGKQEVDKMNNQIA